MARGEDIRNIVRVVAECTNSQEALALLESCSTSCIASGTIFQDLMEPVSIRVQTQFSSYESVFEQIEQDLRAGKHVIVEAALPLQSAQHVFTVEPMPVGSSQKARIVHSWQDRHPLRAENEMFVDEMSELLKKVFTLDWVTARNELKDVFHKLFGADNAEHIMAGVSEIEASAGRRRKAIFKMVVSGKQKNPLGNNTWCQWLEGFIGDVHSGVSAGAALGLLFGLGGVLISGERDPIEAALAVAKSTTAFGAEAAAMKFLTTNWESSIVRDNAVSGLAFFAVFAIWDVTEWELDRITGVELRHRVIEGLAGTTGGVAGGVAGGAAYGEVMGAGAGPVGALLGALVGGFVGAVLGAWAGQAIEAKIWDKSEDSVMNSYEFFGWHDVKRNTRPVKTADEWEKAYDKKLERKPSEIKEEDWAKVCMVNLMVLLPEMYPVFIKIMRMANSLRVNRSVGASVIATMMYNSVVLGEEESRWNWVPIVSPVVWCGELCGEEKEDDDHHHPLLGHRRAWDDDDDL